MFNVVQGIGEEAGAALVAHPLLRRVSFTGSPETGRLIAGAAAANLVPFTAELGGKNPFVVFADADLDAAARKAAGQYDDAGQVCLSGTRLLVEESVRDEFLERFDAAVDEHVLGDPRDDATTVSPMIHPDHVARVEGFVERARESGHEILRGGRRLDGLFFEPTLIRPTGNDAEIVQREVFGPVLTLQTFRTEEEAIALANSTEYGLSALIYTGSMGRADRVGRAVRGGTVWVNTFLVRDLTAPFGGMGISGHRPRGRRLRARLLLRPQDAADPGGHGRMTDAEVLDAVAGEADWMEDLLVRLVEAPTVLGAEEEGQRLMEARVPRLRARAAQRAARRGGAAQGRGRVAVRLGRRRQAQRRRGLARTRRGRRALADPERPRRRRPARGRGAVELAAVHRAARRRLALRPRRLRHEGRPGRDDRRRRARSPAPARRPPRRCSCSRSSRRSAPATARCSACSTARAPTRA